MTAQLPSKVRLAQIASFSKSMALPPSHDEIEAMARFALAAHEQEPVAWRIHTPMTKVTYVEMSSESVERVRKGCADNNIVVEITPLYTHRAPAPAVPECFERLLAHAQGIAMGVDWNKGTAATHHRDKLCQAVKDCAAMPNGGKS